MTTFPRDRSRTSRVQIDRRPRYVQWTIAARICTAPVLPLRDERLRAVQFNAAALTVAVASRAVPCFLLDDTPPQTQGLGKERERERDVRQNDSPFCVGTPGEGNDEAPPPHPHPHTFCLKNLKVSRGRLAYTWERAVALGPSTSVVTFQPHSGLTVLSVGQECSIVYGVTAWCARGATDRHGACL